jgi:hypothetical protein
MNTRKFFLGGIAGGVAYFLLGWLIYGLLLSGYMNTNYNQCAMKPMEEMVWWALILSNFAFTFLLALIFSWSNIKGLMGGVKIAAIIGFLISVSYDLSMFSMTTTFVNFGVAIVDIVIGTIMTAVIGGIIILVMDMVKAKE